MVSEEWKDIPGLEHYEVSNLGNARRKKYRTKTGTYTFKDYHQRPLTVSQSSARGAVLRIKVDGKCKTYYIAPLVERLFGAPPPGMTVGGRKLTALEESQVLEAYQAGVKTVYAKGDATQTAQAKKFGVSVALIQRTLKRAKATVATTTGACS